MELMLRVATVEYPPPTLVKCVCVRERERKRERERAKARESVCLQEARVWAGEALPFKQSDICVKGWAIESRIYAEDSLRNFLPSVGVLHRYRPPKETRVC